MAASATLAAKLPPLPAERFFRASLFFLILTSVATLVSTGKLDPFTCVVAPLALLYKGVRLWRSQPPEVSHTTATWAVIGYLAFFPVDIFFVSRAIVANSTNPALLAALLAAVHFLLLVMVVRLFSATTDRDALFLAMLAFAAMLAASILTVDTSFLILFFIFMVFGVAAFIGLELRRAANGTIASPFGRQPADERRLSRALSLAPVSVPLGSVMFGGVIFFVFPRFTAGYLGRAGMQPSLMTGFSDNIELGQIGEIKKNSEVVMRVKTGKPVGYPMLRWRGTALTTFDGKRWTKSRSLEEELPSSADGWIYLVPPGQAPRSPGTPLQYTAFLEPIATSAIFTASQVIALRGNFSGEGSSVPRGGPGTYIGRGATDSLLNPFGNFSPLRYVAISHLPGLNVSTLRAAPSDYSDDFRQEYLQLPEALDPPVPELARQIRKGATSSYDKGRGRESVLRTRLG